MYPNSCLHCESKEVVIMDKWRYFLFLSGLPILVSAVVGYIVHPIFFLMIFLVSFINMKIAKKKTPIIICKSCRQINSNQSLSLK